MSELESRVAGVPCGSAEGGELRPGGTPGTGWPRAVVVVVIVLAVAALAAARVPLPMPLVWLASAAATAVAGPRRMPHAGPPCPRGALGGV